VEGDTAGGRPTGKKKKVVRKGQAKENRGKKKCESRRLVGKEKYSEAKRKKNQKRKEKRPQIIHRKKEPRKKKIIDSNQEPAPRKKTPRSREAMGKKCQAAGKKKTSFVSPGGGRAKKGKKCIGPTVPTAQRISDRTRHMKRLKGSTRKTTRNPDKIAHGRVMWESAKGNLRTPRKGTCMQGVSVPKEGVKKPWAGLKQREDTPHDFKTNMSEGPKESQKKTKNAPSERKQF